MMVLAGGLAIYAVMYSTNPLGSSTTIKCCCVADCGGGGKTESGETQTRQAGAGGWGPHRRVGATQNLRCKDGEHPLCMHA